MQYLLTQEEYEQYSRWKNTYKEVECFIREAIITGNTKLEPIENGAKTDKVHFSIEIDKLPKLFKFKLKEIR